jgi:hypothetical protein
MQHEVRRVWRVGEALQYCVATQAVANMLVYCHGQASSLWPQAFFNTSDELSPTDEQASLFFSPY